MKMQEIRREINRGRINSGSTANFMKTREFREQINLPELDSQGHCRPAKIRFMAKPVRSHRFPRRLIQSG